MTHYCMAMAVARRALSRAATRTLPRTRHGQHTRTGTRTVAPYSTLHQRHDEHEQTGGADGEGEVAHFLGAPSTRFTSRCRLSLPGDHAVLPTVRFVRPDGTLCIADSRLTSDEESLDDQLVHLPSDASLRAMYRSMIYVHLMDGIFYDAQRQGRISFYMTNYGEEAAAVGSCAALRDDDEIFAQYREAGVFMHRGFPLQQFAHQCFSNVHDLGKGRQMPVHYGSSSLHIQTISSPLGTQLPQAAGAAYALKREGKGRCVVCYFGEGAASEGDFHPALNMAATLACPVIYFVRNNGYAISTPTSEQYRGDGIASRAAGYGMACLRVDGNDLLAVHHVTRLARRYAVDKKAPVLIEAMTYRGGHHSTSDDSTRYRSMNEITHWQDNANPISRLRLFMERRGLWDSEQETRIRKQARADVLEALRVAEAARKPPIDQMFEDVYDELPQHLKEQRDELHAHLAKYGEKYGLETFEREDTYVTPSIEKERALTGGKQH